MRFDPFAEFDRLSRPQSSARTNAMPADGYRSGDRFFLHLDLPGVDSESIDLTVEKNTLTVTAERSWNPGEEASVVVNERPQGTFRRQFFLGEMLDVEGIEAGYDHGVLTITIPVAEQAKPRKIVIGAGDQALAN